MEVLLLGMNYASTINSTVSGLRENKVNVTAYSYEINRSQYNDYSEIHCFFPDGNSHISKPALLRSILELAKAIRKADVIHLFSDFRLPTRFHRSVEWYLFNVAGRKKKKFITYVGSEIRIPKVEIARNPFYEKAYQDENYEYRATESKANSIRHQQRFSKLGFNVLSPPDVADYLVLSLKNLAGIIHHPGKAPSKRQHPHTKKLHFVHAPSAPVAKGTAYVLAAMKKLKAEGYDFDFTLLQGLSNKEYIAKLNSCDVYLDQFVWGWYGVAAIQAMGMGIPVVAYLTPEIQQAVPRIPILNCTGDDLSGMLSDILENPGMLEAVSEKSREFYETHHKPSVCGRELIKLYRN